MIKKLDTKKKQLADSKEAREFRKQRAREHQKLEEKARQQENLRNFLLYVSAEFSRSQKAPKLWWMEDEDEIKRREEEGAQEEEGPEPVVRLVLKRASLMSRREKDALELQRRLDRLADRDENA